MEETGRTHWTAEKLSGGCDDIAARRTKKEEWELEGTRGKAEATRVPYARCFEREPWRHMRRLRVLILSRLSGSLTVGDLVKQNRREYLRRALKQGNCGVACLYFIGLRDLRVGVR